MLAKMKKKLCIQSETFTFHCICKIKFNIRYRITIQTFKIHFIVPKISDTITILIRRLGSNV